LEVIQVSGETIQDDIFNILEQKLPNYFHSEWKHIHGSQPLSKFNRIERPL